jgi:hypothetical protein
MLLLGAQRLLEVPPPRIEALLGRRIEAQEGQFLGRQLLGTEPVAKDEDSVYEGGATRRWLKVKQKDWTVGEDRWRRRISAPS